jgi:hypothetical protein
MFAMHGAACMAADACIVISNNVSLQLYMQIPKFNEQLKKFKLIENL